MRRTLRAVARPSQPRSFSHAADPSATSATTMTTRMLNLVSSGSSSSVQPEPRERRGRARAPRSVLRAGREASLLAGMPGAGGRVRDGGSAADGCVFGGRAVVHTAADGCVPAARSVLVPGADGCKVAVRLVEGTTADGRGIGGRGVAVPARDGRKRTLDGIFDTGDDPAEAAEAVPVPDDQVVRAGGRARALVVPDDQVSLAVDGAIGGAAPAPHVHVAAVEEDIGADLRGARQGVDAAREGLERSGTADRGDAGARRREVVDRFARPAG